MTSRTLLLSFGWVLLMTVASFFVAKPAYAYANFPAPGEYPTEGEAWVACQTRLGEILIPPDYDAKCEAYTGTSIRQYLRPPSGSWQPNGTYFWNSSGDCSSHPSFQVVGLGTDNNSCVLNCAYNYSSGTCDAATNICLFNASPSGDPCTSNTVPTVPTNDLPSGCIRNESTGEVVCDCSVAPDAAWCINPPESEDPHENCILNEETGYFVCYTGGSDPNDPTNPDDPPDVTDPPDPNDPPGPGGDDSGGDDTDPNDPVDGDGDKDSEDCNPFSDADCAFTGSANAVSVCGSPPSCSGDPVQCAQLTQSYNVMCAVLTAAKEKTTGTAQSQSGCGTQPPCTGDAVQCSILVQSWKSMCYLTKDDGQPFDETAGVAEPIPFAFSGEEFTTIVDINADGGLKTTDGFLAAGSCPATFLANVAGGDFYIDFSPFCQTAQWLSYLVMFMASIASARIVFT